MADRVARTRSTLLLLAVLGPVLIAAAIAHLALRLATSGPNIQHNATTLASPTQKGRELLVTDQAPPRYRPTAYNYVMPEEQQRQLLREAPRLRSGETVEQVVVQLGPPLEDKMLYAKGGNWPPTRALTYCFAKRDLELVNIYDPSLEIFFDAQGHLQSVASNVPSVPSLNWLSEGGHQADGDVQWTPATQSSSQEERGRRF